MVEILVCHMYENDVDLSFGDWELNRIKLETPSTASAGTEERLEAYSEMMLSVIRAAHKVLLHRPHHNGDSRLIHLFSMVYLRLSTKLSRGSKKVYDSSTVWREWRG